MQLNGASLAQLSPAQARGAAPRLGLRFVASLGECYNWRRLAAPAKSCGASQERSATKSAA